MNNFFFPYLRSLTKGLVLCSSTTLPGQSELFKDSVRTDKLLLRARAEKQPQKWELPYMRCNTDCCKSTYFISRISTLYLLTLQMFQDLSQTENTDVVHQKKKEFIRQLWVSTLHTEPRLAPKVVIMSQCVMVLPL